MKGGIKRPIYLDGAKTTKAVIKYADGKQPPNNLTTQHLWPETFPSWDTPGACVATKYGAKGDLLTDDTAALQKMLDDPVCKVAVIPKGYFSISSTIVLPSDVALVGVGMMYSNIVPHPATESSRLASSKPWPLLRTATDTKSTATVSALSLLVWRHVNATYALNWQASAGF